MAVISAGENQMPNFLAVILMGNYTSKIKKKKSFFQLKLLLCLPCCHVLSLGDMLHAPFLVMVVLVIAISLSQVRNWNGT